MGDERILLQQVGRKDNDGKREEEKAHFFAPNETSGIEKLTSAGLLLHLKDPACVGFELSISRGTLVVHCCHCHFVGRGGPEIGHTEGRCLPTHFYDRGHRPHLKHLKEGRRENRHLTLDGNVIRICMQGLFDLGGGEVGKGGGRRIT